MTNYTIQNFSKRKIALVSMPWMTPDMPSIQLAILKNLLADRNIETDVFEFYTDLASMFGIELYRNLDNNSFVLAERLFSKYYFTSLPDPRKDNVILGTTSTKAEEDIELFSSPIIERFLEKCLQEKNWGDYDAIFLSLTTVQTAASMVFVKLVKSKFPNLKIIFGGASCAGEMGIAISEVCREVDAVVHIEAEIIIDELLDGIFNDNKKFEVEGITWQGQQSILKTNALKKTYKLQESNSPLNFDSYFDRIHSNGLIDKIEPWIPFESSRGCWWGEKSQCTFCGLNEIIKYRESEAKNLISHLSYYEYRYDCNNFFAVDLIMPKSFPRIIFPEITRLNKNWSIFYEIKSNISKNDFIKMVDGNVTWIQPGIEAIDDKILRNMKKGVSSIQNIELLIWCLDYKIKVNWNLLIGFPEDVLESYENTIDLIPYIYHLPPPSGVGDFEVHRFSPYFENSSKYGINILGADFRYKYCFPIDDTMLNKLVYRFDYEFDFEDKNNLIDSKKTIEELVKIWWNVKRRNGTLTYQITKNSEVLIKDTRYEDSERTIKLNKLQTEIYLYITTKRDLNKIETWMDNDGSKFIDFSGGVDYLHRTIDYFIDEKIALKSSGHILALALSKDSVFSNNGDNYD